MSHPKVDALRLNQFGVPPRYQAVLLLEDLKPTQRQRAAYDGLLYFVHTLRDRYVTPRRDRESYPEDPSTIGKGVLLTGPPGTGKTTLTAATLLQVYRQNHLPIAFISFSDYIDDTIELMRLEKRGDDVDVLTQLEALGARINHAVQAPVTLLDDVGREHRAHGSEFVANELYRLLRHRHRNGLPTLVTSNLPETKWGDVYDESMGSFIQEAFDTFAVGGGDLRAKG